MELNTGHYKYYKCRSLLACDAGGTVYDTSRVYSDGAGASLQMREADESEKIVYILDRDKGDEKKRALVDSTTHLDDDEFNDYEMHSSGGSCELNSGTASGAMGESQIESFDADEQSCQSKDLHRFLIKNEDDSDTISVTQKSELSQDSNHLSDSSYFDSINGSKGYILPKEKIDVYSQMESNFQYPFVVSQSKYEPDSSKDSFGQEDAEPSAKSDIEFRRNNHKRKQKYTVKDDSFFKIKLKYQKRNPFANVKMNSILKGNSKSSSKNNKNHCKQMKKDMSMSLYNKTVEVDNRNFNNEVIGYKTSYHVDKHSTNNKKDEFVQMEVNTIINLNADLTDADYFDYVQPREKVIESDMDKLLSPTIEIDFSEIFKVHQRNHVIEEKQNQNTIIVEKQKPDIDCNGNEVDFGDIQKMSSLKSLSLNEVAEKELLLKSIYAKKLGFENYFNTSNDSVVNDILYDQGLDYKDIEMDTNFIIMNIEVYSKQNQFDKSCTLLESIYEFNRFGGFVEENSNEGKPCYTEENSNELVINDTLYNFSEDKFHVEPDSTWARNTEYQKENSQSQLIFNFSNKSNLLGVDCHTKFNSVEGPGKVKNEIKHTPLKSNQTPSLKIKIKRINDENNEYVIDDSNEQLKVKKKKKSKPTVSVAKSTKDIDRYECNECSMKFRTKRILHSHMSEYHKGPYDTECDICHMKFRRSSAHKKHESWCEKNIIHKCDMCHKTYCYQASLLKHMKTHLKTSQ